LADPELAIELVTAEPDVVSPVAIAWDADGRMFVAEMIGYPATERSCRIALLEDPDGDSKYERTTTFADGLSFVTSVLPYRDGLLATAAPDLLFLQDTDGDGRADIRRVEWTGFGTGSQQLRANSLHYGLDNWIYGANGRCDGDIRRPDAPPESAVSLRTRDFRFHPQSGKFEAIAGQSQFGQAHDDWGNRFLSWNTIPIRHAVIEDRYVTNDPQLALEAVFDLTDPSDFGRVFPISPPPRQFNTEQANYYNALCGLTIYRGDQLGPRYSSNAFVCESLTNLVTRRVLEPIGPTFVSRRADTEPDREFLASIDNWFHPVNLATGPDGALYIVDFYREFVEHPIYVADEKARNATDWRHGAEHGRIWRIRNKNAPAHHDRTPSLSRADTNELIALLEHPVGWWRDTAQRLLVERQDAAAVESLRRMAEHSTIPLGRLHALWTLEGFDAIDERVLLAAMRDHNPGVRQHAIRFAEENTLGSTALAEAVLRAASDADDAVRFQVALTLGSLDDPQAAEAIIHLLGRADDKWMRLAVLCSAARAPWRLLSALTQQSQWVDSPSADQAAFLEALGERIVAEQDVAQCTAWLTSASSGSDSPARIAVLAGLAKGRAAARLSPADLTSLLDAAATAATNIDAPLHLRLHAIEVVAHFRLAGAETVLLDAMSSTNPPEAQVAAARALAGWANSTSCRNLYLRWPQLGIAARQETLAAAPRTPVTTAALLDALDVETVLVNELPAATRAALAERQDLALKPRIDRLLADTNFVDRAAVVAQYSVATNMAGDVRRGAGLFAEHCLVCHAIQARGGAVGPDLSGVGSRRSDLLLVDILDPSRTVSADFVNYVVTTEQGQTLTGLIAAETAGAITLLTPTGQRETIERMAIDDLRSTGKSIMPDGIEEKLSAQQLADVLEFLRRPDRELLPAADNLKN
jgi:putative membrane-bound dehydrogenase-like protein